VQIDETLSALGPRLIRILGSVNDLAGDVLGYVPGPAFCGVERNHPEGILVLAGDEAANDALTIRRIELGLDVGTAQSAEKNSTTMYASTSLFGRRGKYATLTRPFGHNLAVAVRPGKPVA
jgi:hypothetical protein